MMIQVCSEISPTHGPAQDILLRDMWNLELHKNPDFVEDTADQAKQEMKMENTLKKLQKEQHGRHNQNHHFVGFCLFFWLGRNADDLLALQWRIPAMGIQEVGEWMTYHGLYLPIFSPEISENILNTN